MGGFFSGKNMKIAIPQNQKSVVELMQKAGWTPTFEEDRSNLGAIMETGSPIIALRSMDSLRSIAAGKADIGFVGSDCIAEKPYWTVENLSEFSFGRSIGSEAPRLEIVSSDVSPIFNLSDVRCGSIFLSERPRLTYQYLTAQGLKVKMEDGQNPRDFKDELLRTNQVGISTILGSSPVQLEPGNDLGVIVNETCRTVTDYNLRVIAKICDIKTVLIANSRSLLDETKREQMLRFQRDLENTYRSIEGSLNIRSRL